MLPRPLHLVIFLLGVISVALGFWIPAWGPRFWGWLAPLGVMAMLLSVAYWLAEWRRIRRLESEGAFDSIDDKPMG
jgi:polyferredoxin